ncbi:hypothetical protein PoB_002322000 [Plakobranchus ocellatus]|uniref:Uncharacterized protein n=1 Tax=Plakobranchus ocellatus TaxID=259542 RepID=A0AAV3ZQ32_9GAST|nr:hypothetical protein PoB_002322000 [Plakobranchus ocellatus]
MNSSVLRKLASQLSQPPYIISMSPAESYSVCCLQSLIVSTVSRVLRCLLSPESYSVYCLQSLIVATVSRVVLCLPSLESYGIYRHQSREPYSVYLSTVYRTI